VQKPRRDRLTDNAASAAENMHAANIANCHAILARWASHNLILLALAGADQREGRLIFNEDETQLDTAKGFRAVCQKGTCPVSTDLSQLPHISGFMAVSASGSSRARNRLLGQSRARVIHV
jgi:hypothetical protein